MDKLFDPLPREEVIKAVERRRPRRLPLIMAKWWGEGLWEQYGERLKHFDRDPHHVAMVMFNPLDVAKMGLSWLGQAADAKMGHDAGGPLWDWAHLDEFIAKMPDPATSPIFDELRPHADKARAEGRYLLFGFWGLFFERPWGLRGMANLMTDYYIEPERIHRLHDALGRLYEGYIERAAREFRPDGFWTSDDLGNQRQLMMKPDHFREFLKPYYARVGAACRKARMHFWLHSCGNNTEGRAGGTESEKLQDTAAG